MSDDRAELTAETRRERQTREEPFGTVYEPGHDTRFVSAGTNPIGTVHERPELDDGEGYALDPKCGQKRQGDKLWASIDADTPEEIARKYGATKFCPKCFDRAYKLGRIGREARR